MAASGPLLAEAFARINGDSAPLDERLKIVRADLKDLAAKAVTVAMNGDDKPLQLAAKRALATLDQLDRKTVDPNFKTENLDKFLIKVAAADVAVDRLGDKLDGGTGQGGLVASADNVVSKLGEFAGMGPALFNPITIAAGALAAIMAGPLIASLLPITLGFAGFAAAAVPEIEKVWEAVGKGPKAIAALSPAEQVLASSIESLKDSFGKLTDAVKPEVITAFSDAITVVNQLMPALKPLMVAAGKAVDAFLGDLVNWLNSPSGQKFIRWLQVDGPKDIKTFGNVLWDVAQFIGTSFDFLLNAGNTWWKNVSATVDAVKKAYDDLSHWIGDDFVAKLITFFTRTLPAGLDIFKNSVELHWDEIELATVKLVSDIIGIMGKLPGPLGAPFRAAHVAIAGELAGIESDVSATSARINADWEKIHGRKVTLSFGLGLPAGVNLPGSHGQRTAPIPGHAAGTSGAAAGWAWVGERGPELMKFHGGETVLNHGQSMRVARGYANGTGFDFTDSFQPSASSFIGSLNATVEAAMQAIVSDVQKTAKLTGGGFGGVSGNVQSYAKDVLAVLAMLGQPSSDLGIVLSQMTTESNGNPLAVNLTDSNAAKGTPSVGLMQVIGPTFQRWAGPFRSTGPFEYGTSVNPLANIYAGLNYAIHSYPDWTAVLGHGHGYASGTSSAAPGLAMVGERGPELVRTGYAKGTKEGLRKQIEQALQVVRGHADLPQRYNAIEMHLQSYRARAAQDRQLIKLGGLKGAAKRNMEHQLREDTKQVNDLAKQIRPLSHERRIVRSVASLVHNQEQGLTKAIADAHSRGMGGLAGTLTHRMNRDKGLDKQFDTWLDRLGPAYTKKEKRSDARFVNSIISSAIKNAGLPVIPFDSGGWLPTGYSQVFNGTGKPELVIPPKASGNSGQQGMAIDVNLKIKPTGTGAFDSFMTNWIQHAVDTRGGGSVEATFGRRSS